MACSFREATKRVIHWVGKASRGCFFLGGAKVKLSAEFHGILFSYFICFCLFKNINLLIPTVCH